MEQYFANRSLIDYARCVTLWTEYESAVSKNSISAALAQLIPEHPALCCNITVSRDNRPTAVSVLRKLTLNDVVVFQNGEESLSELSQSLVNVRFEYDKDDAPLWKLVVYNSRFLFFVLDHSIFDGVSARIFLSQLAVGITAHPENATFPEHIDIPSGMCPPPVFEKLVKIDPPMFYVLKAVLGELIPVWLRPKSTRNIVLYNPVAISTPDGKHHIRAFSVEESRGFLEKSRENEVTVTALLAEALCVAFGQTFDDAMDVTLDIVFDARRFIPESAVFSDPSKLIGPYVGRHQSLIKRTTEFSWTEAAEIGKDLKNGVNLSALYESSMIKYLNGKIQEWLRGKIGKVPNGDIEVSNVGAVHFPDSVTAFGFAQCYGVTNLPVTINVSSVKGGKLSITLVTADSIIGSGNGDKLWENFQRVMEGALN
ncbi:alcohol acetyltransferase [Kockiozyma suomiensis]|uniref:alcohol acetyltransferase n=1 Tax=Kockiozyma suomiensis TaxID=1337062 RepID=UPI0033432914